MSQLQKAQAGEQEGPETSQNEQSWGSALPQLNSVIPILEYRFIGQSGAVFPFVQQQRLLCSGSPGLIPIPGAVSNLWGGIQLGWGIQG